MSKRLELIGQIFDRLTVISGAGINKHGNTIWNCQCECGNFKIISSDNLRSRHTKSCGCLQKETSMKKGNSWKTKKKGEAGLNKLFYKYKTKLPTINLEFSLTKEKFKELTSQNCYYCDLEPRQISNSGSLKSKYKYNGIDRKNNSGEYTIENCVPCCKQCNLAKRQMTVSEFQGWVKRIHMNLKKWEIEEIEV